MKIIFSLVLFLFIQGIAFAQPTPPEKQATEEAITLESSLSLRDPFRRSQTKAEAAADEGGKIPELERYDVEKFKLVGVITGAKKNKALITAPDGKMHVITEKLVIGTRKGIIKKILPKAIVIEEKVVNLLGQEEKVESEIRFDSDDKSKKGFL